MLTVKDKRPKKKKSVKELFLVEPCILIVLLQHIFQSMLK